MKTNKLIIVIYALSFLTSCFTDDEITIDAQEPRVNATGDQGDDIGEPDERESVTIVKDSINNILKATGDQGDDVGNPDD